MSATVAYAQLAQPADLPRPRTVLGLLLNDRNALAALGDAAQAPPYKGAARAPVLYVKPANTYAAPGARIALPPDVPQVVVGASLAIEFARPVRRASRADALDAVAGFRVVADLYAPHESYYRPPIKQKCRDGFCPIGADLAAPAAVGDTAGLGIAICIDGVPAFQASTADCVRDVAQAIVDVSEFMTLGAGDLLLLGVPFGAPVAGAGQHIEIDIERVGSLAFSLIAQELK